MKKIILTMLLVVLILTGCTNSGKQWMKDLSSDFGNGLNREIFVTNAFTGEVVWHYKGMCYIDGSSTQGDVTIMFDTDKDSKKVDFIGQHLIIQAIEL